MISSGNVFINKLDAFIDANLDNPSFTVDTICQALGVSRSQLHRLIKEQTERSTSLYIRKRRLLAAKDLLVNSDLRIAEISDKVGMTNPQNFSTYFTEEFGLSPSEFRKTGASTLPGATFSPPVSVTLPPEPVADLHPAKTSHFGQRWAISGLVLVGLGGVGLLVWLLVGRNREPAAQKRSVPSLAVLPFVNLGPVSTSQACEGIVDEVHTALAHWKALRVIARSSSDQYRNTRKSIWQIGDELQATNLLKGSVLQTGDQILIKVELLRATDDIRIWKNTYRAPYQNLFELTDQLVRDVAAQLQVEATVAGEATYVRTQSLTAYNLFLQGRQLMLTRTQADLLASISRFDQALQQDSTFAEAQAYKAASYLLLPGSGEADTRKNRQVAERTALLAIRLDSINSTAYGVLGTLYHDTRQWKAAEKAFLTGLQNNPNDAQLNYWYSLLLRSVGRVDEALRYSTQAVAMDPLHPIIMGGHIVNCMYANRPELARTNIDNGRALFNQSFSYQIATAYYWTGKQDYGRAVTSFEKALTQNPDDTGQLPLLMYCEAKRGNHQKVLRFLQQLPQTPRANYERAVVYAGLNQRDSSLTYLKKAADAGYLYRDTKVLPVFVPYRQHPIFRAIMQQFQLPDR